MRSVKILGGFARVFLGARNFSCFLRSKKGFPGLKKNSQKVSHKVSLHREIGFVKSFAVVGNQQSFWRLQGFAGVFQRKIVSQKVSHKISLHREIRFRKKFRMRFPYFQETVIFAKPLRNRLIVKQMDLLEGQ